MPSDDGSGSGGPGSPVMFGGLYFMPSDDGSGGGGVGGPRGYAGMFAMPGDDGYGSGNPKAMPNPDDAAGSGGPRGFSWRAADAALAGMASNLSRVQLNGSVSATDAFFARGAAGAPSTGQATALE